MQATVPQIESVQSETRFVLLTASILILLALWFVLLCSAQKPHRAVVGIYGFLILMAVCISFPATWMLPICHALIWFPGFKALPVFIVALPLMGFILWRRCVASPGWLRISLACLIYAWCVFSFIDALTFLKMTSAPLLPASRPLSPNGVFNVYGASDLGLSYNIRTVSPRAPLVVTDIHPLGDNPAFETNSVVAWSPDSKTVAVWVGGVPIFACDMIGLRAKVRELHPRSDGYRLPMPGVNSREAVVRHLLTNDFSIQDFFCQAASEGDVASLQMLGGLGGDANQSGYGYPPLSLAVLSRRRDAAVLLLQMGANPNFRKETNDWTFLMTAAANGETEMVRILLAHGADKEAVDKSGMRAVDLAKKFHKPEIVSLLEAR